MKNKKELAKLALSALVVASAIPVSAQADFPAMGIFLAAGCAQHGCPAAKNNSADASATLTEAQLLGGLNAQARSTYLGLTPEGKALAIQLASQSASKDKTSAVKEAQMRMSERSASENK